MDFLLEGIEHFSQLFNFNLNFPVLFLLDLQVLPNDLNNLTVMFSFLLLLKTTFVLHVLVLSF